MREVPSLNPNIVAQFGDYYKLKKGNFGNKITATILNLAVQKIISIEEGPGKEIVFVSLNPRAPMSRFELNIYNLLFPTASWSEDDRKTLKEFKEALESGSVSNSRLFDIDKSEFDAGRYVDAGLEKKNNIWKGIPFIPLILVIPIIAISIIIEFDDFVPFLFFSSFISLVAAAISIEKTPNALTVSGEDERAKAKALRRFYTDMTLIKERRAMGVYLWEQHLVYATALGVADKVIKELDISLVEMGVAAGAVMPSYIYAMHNTGGLSKAVSNINSASYAAFARSAATGGGSGGFSSGGGGGFSGGGGGGFGGGGGGHR
jgi:uncharacterized membrane protein